ncbi:MAG: methylmalonyl-CoA mutase family protein [Bacteroidales bacterium]|nr:methylmalonyl-CoA mutase family protein [Bacteroidales bacterium]
MDIYERTKLFSEFPPIDTSDWEEKIRTDLKGADYAKKLIWKTGEGFDVKPYYRAEDLSGLEYLNTIPGNPPYVRGLRKENNDWIVREDIGSTDLGKSNLMARNAIASGAGAVGLKVIEVTTHKQMAELLAGIDFHKTAINFTSAKSYPLALEFLIYELSHREHGGDKMKGSVNFDPISYLLLHGEFYISWENDLDEARYLLGIVKKRIPGFKVITVNGHYFQNSGSSLVQELAFSLASASEYLACLSDRGAPVDDVAPYVQFSLGIGTDYFMEVAKFRAVRLLWTRMLEQYQAKHEESFRLFIHATTALWNKSIYDPYVNMLRTTTEGMSAALGNIDSMTINPFDTSYKDSDEISRRVALNQQMLLKEESYLNKIVDPGAGSYYIENLTHAIAHHSWELFKDVESRGGMMACIKSGFIQDEVERSRNQKIMAIAQRKIIMLGTNQYPNVMETMSDSIQPADDIQAQVGKTYKVLAPFRVASGFEEIRLSTEGFVNKGNKRPAVFLLTIGNLAMLRARAGFATNFFGCAGYEIIDNQGFTTVDDGVTSALASNAGVIVICSSDEEYPQIVPEIAGKIKAAGSAARIVVAGFPKDFLETFQSAGVDDFIHVKSNLLETLRDFQYKLGIQSASE